MVTVVDSLMPHLTPSFTGPAVNGTNENADSSLDTADFNATPLRRDFNLIRLILIEVEQPGRHLFRYKNFEGRMIQNHLVMLIRAGFLEGNMTNDGNGIRHAEVEGLTWNGHDLLAQIRSRPLWERAQSSILDGDGRAHLSTLTRWLSDQQIEQARDRPPHPGLRQSA